MLSATSRPAVEKTHEYRRDIDRIVETKNTARELDDQVLGLNPKRLSPGPDRCPSWPRGGGIQT
jgi:hypothetical protein